MHICVYVYVYMYLYIDIRVYIFQMITTHYSLVMKPFLLRATLKKSVNANLLGFYPKSYSIAGDSYFSGMG